MTRTPTATTKRTRSTKPAGKPAPARKREAPAKARPVKTSPRPQSRGGSAKFRTYQSAVQYLAAMTNYEMGGRVDYSARTFNLERTRKLLAALGHPERSMKTIHVAGTKGKGSTVAMLSCMLHRCGYKVGSYTSPHLLSLRERMTINSRMPSEAEFCRAMSKVAVAIEHAFSKGGHPTFFETMTATAFVWFAAEGVQVAVVETGLGGRLDATNVINPAVCGITSISYDHMDQLGSTLESIAAEKAGIIKDRVPVVTAPQTAGVMSVLRETAARKNAPLLVPGLDNEFSYRFEATREHGPHTRLSLTTGRSRFEHLRVPLPGDHQAINCSVALSMLDVLKDRGFAIDDQKAVEGLADVRLSGRMEMVSEEPRVIVDGAHNAASVEALMRAIGQTIPYDSMVVIFACQKDKDIPGMLRHVQLGADKIIFTSAQSPRSADPEELLHMFQERCSKMAQVAPTLEGAMEIATSAISRGDLICITGSFYIAGKAKRLFNKLD